jgi:nitroreductase
MQRKADHDIHPLILNRWSPRAMSGETIEDEELFSLFEAARWAPSSYNIQPWRFVYAKKGTKHFEKFFNLLVDFNKQWCKNAAVLCLIISQKQSPVTKKTSKTHSFDTGAAWENLALQGSHQNLVIHGLEGFDYTAAKTVLHIPDDFEIECMFCIGKKAPLDSLAEDLKKREIPSTRMKVSEIIFEGNFH